MNWSENRWLWLAFASILIGYLLLATTGNIVISPILLVLGYCILIPFHLWTRYRSGVGE